MHGQRNAIARAAPLAGQLDLQRRAVAQELRLGRRQVQRQAAQRGVADVHAHHGAAQPAEKVSR